MKALGTLLWALFLVAFGFICGFAVRDAVGYRIAPPQSPAPCIQQSYPYHPSTQEYEL